MTTEHGSKSFTRVAPGKTVLHPFTIPAGEIPPGVVSVAVAGHGELAFASVTEAAGYDGRTCS